MTVALEAEYGFEGQAAFEKVLSESTVSASDLLDGGATLRERARAAAEIADHAANQLIADRRAVAKELAEAEKAHLAAQDELIAAMPEIDARCQSVAASRDEYESVHARAVALFQKANAASKARGEGELPVDVPKRVPNLSLRAVDDRSLEQGLRRLALWFGGAL